MNFKSETITLHWHDYLVALGIFFNICARIATGYINTSINKLVTNAHSLETNPATKGILNNYYLQFILVIVSYCTILTVYLYVRETMHGTPKQRLLLTFFSLAVFLFFLSDFINDASIVLAIILPR